MRFTDEGTPGTVVLVTADLGRYGAFEHSLEGLIVPAKTQLLRVRGGSSANNQNVGVKKRTGEWVWFIDDDHTFAPEIVMRLLARNVDIVAPVVPMRHPPYNLVLYKQLEMAERDGRVVDFAETFYTMSDLNGLTGMIPVQGLPKAGCLVRESVWAQMPMPVFKIGLIHPDEVEDDKYFMWEVREKYRFTLWCDTDQSMTHLTTIAVGCLRNDAGQYNVRIFA